MFERKKQSVVDRARSYNFGGFSFFFIDKICQNIFFVPIIWFIFSDDDFSLQREVFLDEVVTIFEFLKRQLIISEIFCLVSRLWKKRWVVHVRNRNFVIPDSEETRWVQPNLNSRNTRNQALWACSRIWNMKVLGYSKQLVTGMYFSYPRS